jgi:enamine deaminase RidA (YjgF/YER057c/UK114 family)
MRRVRALVELVILLVLARSAAAQGQVRLFRTTEASATSAAALVAETAGLAHTAQLFPLDDQGKLVGPGQPQAQAEAVLEQLAQTLGAVDLSLDRLVKVNVYCASDEAVVAFQKAFSERVGRGPARPAIAFVVGALAVPGALVAADAVAAAPGAGDGVRMVPAQGRAKRSSVALLPPGGKVYISGQAEPGTLLQATRATLESLKKTLDYLGLTAAQVVQMKAFMTPIASAREVEQEIAAFYGDQPAPPLVFVEWRMPKPIEIEIVAACGRGRAGEAIEFLTPPGLKPSPVFSRVARINRGPLIYIGGLHGKSGTSGSAQTEAIFDALKLILAASGSDLRHMAKATYYVSDDEASKALNDLRPRFFDPKRPPAASKATVEGGGTPGCSITLDMIAVPAPAD